MANERQEYNPTLAAAMQNMGRPAPVTTEQKLDDALRRIEVLESSLDQLTRHYEAEMTADGHPLIEQFDQIVDALTRHNILPRAKQEPLPSRNPPALLLA